MKIERKSRTMGKKLTGIENPAILTINKLITAEEENAQPEKKTKQSRSTEQQTKSKRLNLLLRPALLEDLKKIAAMERTSVNDLINTVLGEYAEREAEQIEKYNSVFGE